MLNFNPRCIASRISSTVTLMLFIGSAMTMVGCQPASNNQTNAQANSAAANQVVHQNLSAINPAKKATNPANNPSSRCNNALIAKAHQAQNPQQKTQVLGCGQVIKVLPDDNEGSRHQKLLVRIDGYPQLTVLIAHNIDLAPRIDGIKAHTPIQFYGEYIYNDKGGVVHWTHKDPAARHQDGWLRYQGQLYQ